MTRAIAIVHVASAAIGLALFDSAVSAQQGGDFDVSWHTVDGGGGTFSAGGDFRVGGTLGQADAGEMAGGDYFVIGGFWGVGVPPCSFSSPCAANLDGQTGVGSVDLALLLGSWGLCDGCGADLNCDGFVNSSDLALLLSVWGACG